MTKKIMFRLRADLLIEADSERDALAIVAEHMDRVAAVKDRNQVGNPFAGGKWEIQMIFTEALRNEFQKAYDEAVAGGKQQFTWHDMDFLTDYAKYLLEYLQTQPLRPH